MGELIAAKTIEKRIFLIRGLKVMLSSDLAALYGVEPRALIQAVKRNKERFPDDFMIQLTLIEAKSLRSQFVILNEDVVDKRGQHLKYAPYAFTEQGVAMLSSVLKSRRAVLVNIAIMRAFVKLREMMVAHRELAEKLSALERRVVNHDKHIHSLFDAIRRLTDPLIEPKPPIGFQPHKKR